jgi:hypothetical protein
MSGMYIVMPTIEVRVRARISVGFFPVRFLATGVGLGFRRIVEKDDFNAVRRFVTIAQILARSTPIRAEQ